MATPLSRENKTLDAAAYPVPEARAHIHWRHL